MLWKDAYVPATATHHSCSQVPTVSATPVMRRVLRHSRLPANTQCSLCGVVCKRHQTELQQKRNKHCGPTFLNYLCNLRQGTSRFCSTVAPLGLNQTDSTESNVILALQYIVQLCPLGYDLKNSNVSLQDGVWTRRQIAKQIPVQRHSWKAERLQLVRRNSYQSAARNPKRAGNSI